MKLELHFPAFALALIATFATGSAWAQGGTPPPRSFGTGTLPEFLQPYDVNGDGRLSEEERQAAKAHRAERAKGDREAWDKDKDGKLSEAERQAAHEQMRAQIETLRSRRFDEADLNGDAKLSREEFARVPGVGSLPYDMVMGVFARLDTDRNGFVSKPEFLLSLAPPPPPPPPPVRVPRPGLPPQ